MFFSSVQNKINNTPKLTMNGTALNQVDKTTYLGLNIDENLTRKPHISSILKKISPLIGLLSKLRHYLLKFASLLLYNSLILPHLSYGLEVWGSIYHTSLTPIYILQKKIVRIIMFKDKYTHSTPLFNSLGILHIFNQFKYQICIFIHDLLHNRLPRTLHDYFSSPVHSYPTRSSTNFNFSYPSKRTNYGQFSIDYKGAKIWNQLPQYLKIINNRNQFKGSLKLYFSDNS